MGDVAGCDCAVEGDGRSEDEGDGLLAGREAGAGSLRTGDAAGLATVCAGEAGSGCCSPASCRPRRMSVSPTSRRKLKTSATRITARARLMIPAAAARFKRGDSTRKSSAEKPRTSAGGGTWSTGGRLGGGISIGERTASTVGAGSGRRGLGGITAGSARGGDEAEGRRKPDKANVDSELDGAAFHMGSGLTVARGGRSGGPGTIGF